MKMLSELTSTFSWNSTSQGYTLIKVICGLVNKNLRQEVEKDYQQLLKNRNEFYMKSFYDEITKINEFLPISGNEEIYLREIEQTMFPIVSTFNPERNTYKDALTGKILQVNYRMLKENELLVDYLNKFHSYFSGEMVAIHRVPDSDIIIFELKQKPFSNARQYHWDEPDRNKFYSSINTSCVFNTFNECFIFSLFPTHYQTVRALLEVEKNNILKIENHATVN